ncbi:hypothetical protein [Streptomyces sp. NPDC047108]|uniref:hypothetical protein n=1 Tax=Streptomyces sp. NPDC047108 TaxID=3155025 RepID=UPI0034067CAB
MPIRTHSGRARAAALATLAVAAGVLAAAPAAASAATGPAALSAPPARAVAASGPAFLAPGQLPPHPSSPWYAGPVTNGTPDPLPFCVGQALPGATSQYREFWTELDTGATQVTVVERDTARARSLAALWNKAIRECADRTEQEDPDVTAEWRGYGKLAVEEGARVQGVHLERTGGASDVHLFAVGRDGRTVTVVRWGQMGTFDDAPVRAFKNTTRTAVNKLW